ncbi:hypothetical protein BIFADO_00368 [Bifidobacterium adolescentis L2-32]|uniref:Uncharacterized protein n=1 Tax=Bifidobacterium adolescentis L2-32 TaxID=411481 RepID=A7A3H8_BIFAD|nr:hypothetical protein BIFADO_00368 [Bifidobacterium adolescentis L2-32]
MLWLVVGLLTLGCLDIYTSMYIDFCISIALCGFCRHLHFLRLS